MSSIEERRSSKSIEDAFEDLMTRRSLHRHHGDPTRGTNGELDRAFEVVREYYGDLEVALRDYHGTAE